MAKLSIQVAATSQTINIFIQDSSSTTGAGLTGLVYNSSGLVAYYALPKAAAVQITLATLAAITTAYSSGGFKEVDATNMPGWYRLDLPDAAIASGRFVSVHLKGATNMAPCPLEIELTAWNNQDAVRGGMTALPNANAAAANGLPVLGTNATLISFTAGMVISNASGDALQLTSSGSNGNGLAAAGNGSGAGLKSTAGATGNGLQLIGGATSGSGMKVSGTAGNAIALELVGQGSATALSATGGATGPGAKFVGGATSGDGVDITTTSGDGLSILPTAGNAIVATANGTSKHGAVITGGTAGTSDGIKAVAGTGGVDFRANQTGNLTGNVSGSVGSVTGAVGSVTARVTANTDQWAGGTIPSPTVAGVPNVNAKTWNDLTTVALPLVPATAGRTLVVDAAGLADANVVKLGPTGSGTAQTARDIGASVLLSTGTGTGQLDFTSGVVKANLAQILGTALTETAGQIAAAFKQFFNIASPTSTMNVITTVTTTTTATNLTTNNDKAGYGLSSAAVQAIWDALTSALTTTGSIGKRLADFITGDAYVRLGAPAGASTAADISAVKGDTAAIKTKTDLLVNPTRTGTAQAGAAGTITLDSGASAVDDYYTNQIIVVTGGTGAAQSRIISGYVGSTNVASVNGNWATNPDNTSVFALIAFGAVPGASAPTAAQNAAAVWDEAIAGHLSAGSTGLALSVAGSAGDPWSTAIPGAYGAGTAGFIVGTNVDALISSRTKPADTQAAVTTATNLTNAPTAGDFTATMKTSLNASTPASITGAVGSVTGAVGSVTGNVGGNVVGSVASVTARVTANSDQLAGQTVTASAGVTFPSSVASPTNITAGTITTATNLTTNNDKTGYSLTAGQLFLKKNTGFTLTFLMTDSTTHAPATGLTVSSQRSIDGAALGNTTNSVAEISGGLYKLSISAADVNGTQITFLMTATGADTKAFAVVTQA